MRVPVVLFVVVGACAQQPVLPPVTTSYLRDIQPIVERSCGGCHRQGGVAPMAFDDPTTVQPMAFSMWNAIEAGRMPPFFASADCNRYVGDERLSADERALFQTWVAEGAPLGDPAEARHAQVPAPVVVRHDRVMGLGGAFDARRPGESDVYRCFVLDPGNATEVMVTGYEFMPGNVAMLHHMLAYAVAAADVPQLQALDDADPGLGYACQQGGVGVRGAVQNQVAGWVPGGAPTRLPEGTGLALKGRGRIVMQVHYNTSSLASDAPAVDASQLALELATSTTLTRAQILPMVKFNLDIKAGDTASAQVGELPASLYATSGTIYRAMGHMHQLGTRVRTEVRHADGTSECLLDIPRWDFNWQRDYTLAQPITLRAGDTMRITCTYDNGADNQPFVDGVQQPPRDVAWGEGTRDEMCMTYLTFTK